MIHGELDGTVPVVQADSMARRLKDAGAKMAYVRVKNYTHTGAQGKQEPSAEVVQKAILDFLDASLGTARQ